jgi:hypothetical protein
MANRVNEEDMIQQRNELKTRLDELNQEREQIEREILAITLYLDAIKGVLPRAEPAVAVKPQTDKPRQHRPSGARAPRGERRGAILEILRQEPEGYTFDRILEILGVSDSREQKAVYATLHNMKRKGDITQDTNKHFLEPPTGQNESAPVNAEAG